MKFDGLKPIEALNKLARYFEKVGYIKKIGFERIGENERIYRMEGVSIGWAIFELKEEGGVPPHYSTYIYTTAFKELFDLKFGVVEEKFCATEKWILKKRG